jgi:hypothetical protein
MTAETQPAMADDTRYWKTNKIDVRFNHWEVDPIIERIPVKLVGTHSIVACDNPNHQQYKRLGGTLSLSTIPSLKVKYQACRKDDGSNVHMAANHHHHDPKIERRNDSIDNGRSVEFETVDKIGHVSQNAIPVPHGSSKLTVSLDVNLHLPLPASTTGQSPEPTDTVAPVYASARGIQLTPPSTALTAGQSRNGFKDIFTGPARPVDVKQSRILPFNNSLLRCEDDASATVDDKLTRKKQSKHGRLGEVRPEDVLLLRWLDVSHDWPWIMQERQRLGFTCRARNTLARRRQLVKAALQYAGKLTSPQLLDRVASGDLEACRLLNENCPASFRLQDFKSKGSMLPNQPSKSENEPAVEPLNREASRVPEPDNVSRQLVAAKAHISRDEEHDPYTRVTTGGKTILPEVINTNNTGDEDLSKLRAVTGGKTILPELEAIEIVETDDEDMSTVSDHRRGLSETPELAPEDYCHFAYQVMRQEFYSAGANDVEEAMQAGDSAPMLCGTYDTLQKCNNAVMNELFTQYPNMPSFANGAVEEEWTLNYTMSENREVSGTIFKKGVGALRVRTQRLLRTFYDRIPPNTRAGHFSRSVYTVHKQITRSFTDEIFGEEGHECCDDEIVRANVFTSLRQANEIAIDTFVKATTEHSTGRMNDVLDTIQRIKRKCTDEIDIDADLFDRSHGSKRVCVRKLRLCGPTNL